MIAYLWKDTVYAKENLHRGLGALHHELSQTTTGGGGEDFWWCQQRKHSSEVEFGVGGGETTNLFPR